MIEAPPAAPAAPPPPRGPSRLAPATLAVLLPALLALALHARTVAFGLTGDDLPVIARNPLLQSWSTLPGALLEAYWLQTGNLYRPLTLLAFGVEWNLTGGAPWLTHLVNVLCHALVCALVARLALRWTSPVGALAAGLLFAAHPVHVEAVAGAVGRSELACAGFLLGALLAATREGPWTSRRGWAVAALSALALASKETGVTAPALVWGVLWADPRTRPHAWRAAGAAAAGAVPLLVLRLLVIGRLGGDDPHPVWLVATPRQHWLLVLGTIPRSLASALVPRVPRVEWSPPLTAIARPSVAMAALGAVLVALTVAAVVAHLRRPTVLTTGVWLAAVPFLPTSNLLFASGIVGAERTLYAPSVGACVLLGCGVGWAWERRAPGGSRALARALAAGATAAWLAAALAITVPEVAMWRSDATLTAGLLGRSPTSYWLWYAAGHQALLRGDRAEAYRLDRRAIALFPHDASLLRAAATLAAEAGDDEQSVAWLRHAVELQPASRRTRTLLVGTLLKRGRREEAAAALRDGLRREPDQRVWRRLLDSLSAAGPR